MAQGLKTLRWTKTQTPTHTLTPYTTPDTEQLYVLSQHVYLVRNDSLVSIRRFTRADEDWDNMRFTFRYTDGYSQTFALLYAGKPSYGNLREVQVHQPYTGAYSAQGDTVLSYYNPGGLIPKKYYDDESVRLFNSPQ